MENRRKLLPLLLLLSGFAFGLPSCLTETENPNLEGHDVEVTFIHTADWHSRLLPYALEVGETDESLGLNPNSTTIGGAARAATVIRRIREKGGRVIHLDTGDVFQGAPIFNEYLGEPEFQIYSALNVDAFAVGNHEFDMGVKNFVNQAVEHARFPMLNINYALENPYYEGNSPLGAITHPYNIINVRGLRVAIIGVGSLGSIVSMYEGGNSLGITPLETLDIAQFYIDYLRPMVDVIVVSSHLGLRAEKQMERASDDQVYDGDIDDCEIEGDCDTSDLCISNQRLVGDEQLIANTEGIDVVFGGHLHIVLSPPEVVEDCHPDPSCPELVELMEKRGCLTAERDAKGEITAINFDYSRRVPLMHSGAFLKFIGQLDVVFGQKEIPEGATNKIVGLHDLNGWEVKAFRQTLHPMDDSVPPSEFDGNIQRLLDKYKPELYRRLPLTRYIAYAPAKIRRFASGYGDSALGNIVSTSMQTRRRVETDFALTNTLGIRSDVEKGPVTIETMYNVFPFENTITTLTLSGAEVKSLVDYVTLRSSRRGCSAQAQVSGITFVMNCNSEPFVPPFKEASSYESAHRITIGGSRLTNPEKYGLDENGQAVCSYDGVRCVRGGPAGDPSSCSDDVEPAAPCPEGTEFGEGGCCPAGELCTPLGCGTPLTPLSSYTIAANDYIARGGSGFRVLQFNTTQFNTGIPLRDSVVDFLYINYPGCGSDLSDVSELSQLINDSGKQNLSEFIQTFEEYIKTMKGISSRYASCVADLADTMDKDCAALKERTSDYERCLITQKVNAAEICVDIPCVEAREEGRMERIFPVNK